MRPRAAASIGPEGPLAGPSPTCQLRWSSSSPTGVGDERRPLRITARLGALCKDFRVRRLYESVKSLVLRRNPQETAHVRGDRIGVAERTRVAACKPRWTTARSKKTHRIDSRYLRYTKKTTT